MHETKNLELLNKIENLEGSIRLYFKDVSNKEYSLNIQNVKFNNNDISPITILCKMYNVDSIDKITFVRGCFVDDKLKNIGHIINDDWLINIIQVINRWSNYFKYICELTCDDTNKVVKNQYMNTVSFIDEKNSKNDIRKNECQVANKKCDIITPYERNIYHIYEDKIVLQILRQKARNGNAKEIFIELNKDILDMLKTVEWRFALDSSSIKLYFVNGYYENQTNPSKYGGKNQVNMSEYCYGCKPGLIKYEKIREDYYIAKTTRNPLNMSEFNENLKKYQNQ